MFKDIPETSYNKIAKFLEANDFKEQAFNITPDQDHKFDLAIQLNKIDEAFEIAEAQQSVEKWKKVGDIALLAGFFELTETCFKKAQDYNSLLMFYSSYGDEAGLKYLLDESEKEGKLNITYEVAYLLAMPEKCVDILIKSKRYAEAAMFARSYIPDQIPKVMTEWENVLKSSNMPFIPENIFESKDHKVTMSKAREIYTHHIKPMYNQLKAPADEMDLQRDRWHQDFSGENT